MKLSSPAFKEGGIIPSRYTCEGANVNPPLAISHVPAEAKSLALIVHDPDVPDFVRADRNWDHWIVFDIPTTTDHLAEAERPRGTAGKTTFGSNKYGGPCPPDGEHRYFFKLYALDTMLGLKEGANRKEVERAMAGHILAEAQLMGRYEKGKGY